MNKLTSINKLLDVCNKSLRDNEYNSRTVAGVRDLSHADVEMAILYAEYIRDHGTYKGILMDPRGGVAELLTKYGLTE